MKPEDIRVTAIKGGDKHKMGGAEREKTMTASQRERGKNARIYMR